MMKKRVAICLIALTAIFLLSCKDDNQEIEVSFKVTNIADEFKSASIDDGFKSATSAPISPEDIPCQPYLASYVKATIDDIEHKIGAFYVVENGFEILYTNAVLLSSGTKTLSAFSVWYDNGTPADETDDIILSASPKVGSFLADYVEKPLDFNFTVNAERKAFVAVEVICFDDEHAADFGFGYAGITEISVQALNFFGDFCMKKKSDYAGSLYEEQVDWNSTPGEFHDAPTIAKIELWKKSDDGDWLHEGDFQNSTQGEAIKVIYSNHKTKLDSFELKLFIYVRVGVAFDYLYFHSWKFKDDEKPLQTNDASGGKTTYYALGSCSPSANYIFPGYMTLPPTIDYKIVGATAPGSLGGYVDAEITNTGIGYEFGDGLYRSYCADHTTEIQLNQTYSMDVYSSLYPDLMPLFAQGDKWAKINWLINQIGLPGSNNRYPTHNWNDLQGAIWLLSGWNGQAVGGVSAVNALMQQMAADAQSNYENYVIPPAGWACVVFVPAGTPHNATSPVIQTMFIKVDP